MYCVNKCPFNTEYTEQETQTVPIDAIAARARSLEHEAIRRQQHDRGSPWWLVW